jgi:hypothetical protein
MKLFGIEIPIFFNGRFVKQKECNRVHEALTVYLDGKFDDTNKRIDDLQKAIDNYLKLLSSRPR